MKPLPVGIENFKELIDKNYYFVDKTNLIRDLINKQTKVTLITRPRRFGKTLNMSMLKYFFEDERNSKGEKIDNSYLFEGLEVSTDTTSLEHMGKYPVISISLKDVNSKQFEEAHKRLEEKIYSEFKRHDYVLGKDKIKSSTRKEYEFILNHNGLKDKLPNALKILSDTLFEYYDSKVVLLIDEYDVPLQHAFTSRYYAEMKEVIKTLLGTALKTNDSLEFAVLTGCLRIAKESIFTGLNNFKVVSILNNQYDEYFGFTNLEVENICKCYNLQEKLPTFKEWYDGYIFGNVDVYNPWSIVQYVDDLVSDYNNEPVAYWANTSSNDIIRKFINRADPITKNQIEQLMDGKSINKVLHEDITYEEVFKNIDNLWNFLFFTGYLKKNNIGNSKNVTLTIPNKEVHEIFERHIMEWLADEIQLKDRKQLFQAIFSGDTESVQDAVNDMLFSMISFHDAQENFYHGFMAGILDGYENYTARSNRECGDGRSDIYMISNRSPKDPAYIFEFKVTKNSDNLEEKAKEALEQIEKMQYEKELKQNYGYKEVHKFGIAFCKKACQVMYED